MATKAPAKEEHNVQTWATGRRRTAVARVRIKAGKGLITVNGQASDDYFNTPYQRRPLALAFNATETAGKFDVVATVVGGGKESQADAVQLGIARALVKVNKEFDPKLKEQNLLTRDSRKKERKKYGLRGARRGTQFSKR